MGKPATSSRSKQVQALVSSSCETANDWMNGVWVLAQVLADQMQEIHGGHFSVDIDHRKQFVMVCQDDLEGGVQ